MSDEELRKLALDYDRLTDGGTCRLMATPVNHAGQLARRLLELLPPADDKEPVTEEWLKAVGFLNEDDDEPTFWTVTFNDLNPAFTIDVDPSSTRHAGWIGEAEDYIPWPHDICDRQQVRDICLALGVTLQEPKS